MKKGLGPQENTVLLIVAKQKMKNEFSLENKTK